MKYIVVKGWQGFGDRLESLKMAVWYALEYKLQIYVDWTDTIWSHGNESFYTYFSLVNMPVLKSLDDIPAEATVHPAYWKGRLHEVVTSETEKEIKEKADIGIIHEPYDADVIVLANVGFRKQYKDSTFFANVFRVVDSRIKEKVIQRQIKYGLSKKWGIHLRGTDRTPNLKFKQFRMKQFVTRLFMFGVLNGASMVVLSDDPEYIQIWNSRFSDIPVLTELGTLGGAQGVHTLNKDKLPVSKDAMNVDMLTDFFTLASCGMVFSTCQDSRFAREAGLLRGSVSRFFET
jgi:hypothetical protein